MRFFLREFTLDRVGALCGAPAYRGRLLFSPEKEPCITLRLKKGEDALKWSRKLVEDYACGLPEQG